MPHGRYYISFIESVQHAGADFRAGSWAASAAGFLLYIGDIVQVTDDYGSCNLFMQIFKFKMEEQLCATVEPGRFSIRLARMAQLLRTQRDQVAERGEFPLGVCIFPDALLRSRSDEGCWAWRSVDFNACLSDVYAFRPVHCFGLDPTEVRMNFSYR